MKGTGSLAPPAPNEASLSHIAAGWYTPAGLRAHCECCLMLAAEDDGLTLWRTQDENEASEWSESQSDRKSEDERKHKSRPRKRDDGPLIPRTADQREAVNKAAAALKAQKPGWYTVRQLLGKVLGP